MDTSKTSGEDEEFDEENLAYVASVDELEEGDRVIASIKGREIAIIQSGGEYYGVLNFCPHQGGPVAEGMVAGTLHENLEGDLSYIKDTEIISCPWHGWEFDITSGESLTEEGCKLPMYDIIVRDDDLYISM